MNDNWDDMKTDLRSELHRPRRGLAAPVFGLLLMVAAAIAAWLWFTRPQPAPVAPPPVQQAATPGPAAPKETGIQHPLDAASQPVEPSTLREALVALLGQDVVARMLLLDDFPGRLVATLDNLGRESAPASRWPVAATAGRFTVEEGPDGPVIAAGNYARYTPFVRVAESMDTAAAGALYRRMYPMLEASYRELGFGERYLNDRVVQVIDLLLQTPVPAQPPRVQLTEVKGSVPSLRPWVRYEYVDPQLQQLSAGQKILVRMGPAHAQRIQSVLRGLRAEVARRE